MLQKEKQRVGLFFLKCGLKFLLSVLLLGGPFGFIRVNIRMEGRPREEGGARVAGLNYSSPPPLHSRSCCYPLRTSDDLFLL